MANFEAFQWNFSSSTNSEIRRCVLCGIVRRTILILIIITYQGWNQLAKVVMGLVFRHSNFWLWKKEKNKQVNNIGFLVQAERLNTNTSDGSSYPKSGFCKVLWFKKKIKLPILTKKIQIKVQFIKITLKKCTEGCQQKAKWFIRTEERTEGYKWKNNAIKKGPTKKLVKWNESISQIFFFKY